MTGTSGTAIHLQQGPDSLHVVGRDRAAVTGIREADRRLRHPIAEQADAAGRQTGDVRQLATLLREHRTAARLSQETLAEAAGVAVRTVRNLEGARIARPRRRTVEELANALGLTGQPRARLLQTVHAIGLAPAWQQSSLPPVVSDFVGREAELAQLVAQARRLADQPGNATVVISGPPGVGKTSLVVRAAHLLAAELPGVACHVDLHGLDLTPLSADQAMEQLLTSLGDGRAGPLPASPGERVARYRMLTAARPGLLVLDNAATEDQVRPLLPTGPGWLTLVSSRFTLGGLDSTCRLRLADLDEATARRLLEEIVGADRVAAEPAAVSELIRLCTGLPLALRVAGNRLASRPSWTVGWLVERLRDETRRLDLPQPGGSPVRAGFELSYDQLPEIARRTLRRLALLPWPDYSAPAVAQLLAVDVGAAEAALETLADASLLSPAAAPGRYLLHDLLRVFAAERLAAEEPPMDRDEATARVRAWLLAQVEDAGRWLDPDPRREPAAGTAFDSGRAAMSWLTAERHGWWWAVRQAAAAGRHREVISAAEALHWYSDRYHHVVDWAALFGLAVAAAQACGDPVAEAARRNALGWTEGLVLGRPAAAARQHRAAFRLSAEAGDRRNLGWACFYLTGERHRHGDLAGAVETCARALRELTGAGDLTGRVIAAFTLADLRRQRGEATAAITHLRYALDDWQAARADQPADRHLASRPLQGWIHHRLGHAHADLGQWPEAVASMEAAVTDFAAGGDPFGAGEAALGLGEVLLRAGDPRGKRVLLDAVRRFEADGDQGRATRARRLLRPGPALTRQIAGDLAWSAPAAEPSVSLDVIQVADD
ncbi:helix-turn-helix domain-containing protein [Micromonospora sp. HK10]|uniref:helix-turn-helix domain-containing protein n=1 Tax=Micromonospora sp. HK10 TaxID=1538294 RepID=UPI000697449B|nr:helix-turn-helix domain-containing protein [Micromonospora sp. HK10]